MRFLNLKIVGKVYFFWRHFYRKSVGVGYSTKIGIKKEGGISTHPYYSSTSSMKTVIICPSTCFLTLLASFSLSNIKPVSSFQMISSSRSPA